MGEENAIVIRQKEWTSAQKTRIIALLWHLTQGQSVEELKKEDFALRKTPDLNAGFLAGAAVEAGEILEDLTGSSTSQEKHGL